MQLELLPAATTLEKNRAELKARIARHTRRVFRQSSQRPDDGQLTFDFVLVSLVRSVKTRVQRATQVGIEITTHIGGRLITAVVPDWVIGKGESFVRGWLKAGCFT